MIKLVQEQNTTTAVKFISTISYVPKQASNESRAVSSSTVLSTVTGTRDSGRNVEGEPVRSKVHVRKCECGCVCVYACAHHDREYKEEQLCVLSLLLMMKGAAVLLMEGLKLQKCLCPLLATVLVFSN